MRFRIPLLLVPLLVFLHLPILASASAVSLGESGYLVVASSGGSLDFNSLFNPEGVSASTSDSASANGSQVEASYDITQSVFQSEFFLEVSSETSVIASSRMFAEFSVDREVTYIASGAVTFDDPAAHHVFFEFQLRERNDDFETLFRHSQFSLATPNEAFVVGSGEGDLYGLPTGSITGTLLPGISYEFSSRVTLGSSSAEQPGVGASATGFVRLQVVPEPSSGLLLGVGVVGLALNRRNTLPV